uniref:histidine kinase n=1 Tax=Candidatus Kentrum sp. LFY TaxID=2126342 RepID=A0A450UIR0_9GAMM|nr:MAG: Histidine kinase-, DNA gyrase B-, and HSP90-like ATPase [Candidatus Kentron sp. LFY]
MTPIQTGSAKMRPRARIINLIGDELISDEPVAIVELVKNAYDADATEVEVRFEGRDSTQPERIVVRDDGIGMDLDTVLGAWFEPGTISKQSDQRSPGGRSWLGAKGIGRFAAARLSKTLLLESKTKNADHSVFVTLNWDRFDDESYLDDIEIDYKVRPENGIAHGTTLILKSPRKTQWSEEDFEHLQARLARLVSPFQEISDFKIKLDIPEFSQFSGEVEPPQLVLQPKYLLQGELDESGAFTGKITVDDRVMEVFSSRRVAGKDALHPLCGPFEVEVRAWDRDREGLDPIAERLSIGIREIRKALDNFCGVSIYRDNFRVHPYGEQGNDWLNLDNRSRQNPARNLANNQIIAAIRISREDNPGLQDRSTREGMIINDEHRAFEIWFKNVLSLLEEQRYRVRPRIQKEERIGSLFEPLDISATARKIRKELGPKHPVSTLVADTEKQVREGVERVQETFSRLLMSSGLGQMVDIVIHEIGTPLGHIRRDIRRIEENMEKRCDAKDREHFDQRISRIKSELEQLYNLRGRLDPQTPAKRGRAENFPVQQAIKENFELYDALLKKQRIEWRIEGINKPLLVKMSRATLDQVLANLIDNSIYWLRDEKGLEKGGRIQARIEYLEHGFRILIADDGPDVQEGDQVHIFEPYFSTKRGGEGMGLGLYIARLLIEPYGKILYDSNFENLPGACFEARFEKNVGR